MALSVAIAAAAIVVVFFLYRSHTDKIKSFQENITFLRGEPQQVLGGRDLQGPDHRSLKLLSDKVFFRFVDVGS